MKEFWNSPWTWVGIAGLIILFAVAQVVYAPAP
jgi:hypothetical protein